MQVVDVTRIRSRFSLAGHPQVIDMLCPHCLKDATFTIKGWSEHAGKVAVSDAPCPRCNIAVMFLHCSLRDSPGGSSLYPIPIRWGPAH